MENEDVRRPSKEGHDDKLRGETVKEFSFNKPGVCVKTGFWWKMSCTVGIKESGFYHKKG